MPVRRLQRAWPASTASLPPGPTFPLPVVLWQMGDAWWLALETVIAREGRVSLVMDRKEQHFDIASTAEKPTTICRNRLLRVFFVGRFMSNLPSSRAVYSIPSNRKFKG